MYTAQQGNGNAFLRHGWDLTRQFRMRGLPEGNCGYRVEAAALM